MSFGKWERLITDEAGNVIRNAFVEVRRQVPGTPLAVPLYGDRDGATTISNPFPLVADDDGMARFYAPGGWYQVRIYAPGGYDKVYTDEAVGTAQASDINAYVAPGWTMSPEDQTSAPPSTGCIRFNNADVSLATHLFVHKTAMSGAVIGSWLLGLAPGGKSIRNRLLLTLPDARELGWMVNAASDAGAYIDITVDAGTYNGPPGPVTIAPVGFVALAAEVSGANGVLDGSTYPDLAAIEALAGTGFPVRTAANTWAQRTFTGTANEIAVTFGDGVSGNPVFSLPLALTFTGKTVTGGTYASPAAITGLPNPSNAQDAATKAYVDSVVAGLDVKGSVVAATTANITLSGMQTIDGVSIGAGNRVLVKNQSTASQNGIYVAAAGAWARSTDMDNWAEVPGAFVFVEQGTIFADCAFVCTANDGGTLGTTAITWTQFAGVGTYTAGAGLSLTGAQFAVHPRLADLATITPSQGDVLYFDGAKWERLPAGASGQFLRTLGAANNPEWATIAGGGDLLAANNLSDLANAATARTNLGVAIGSDVQGYSALLAALASGDIWVTKSIGEIVLLPTNLTGVSAPPQSSSLYTYIVLTAGQTGSGQYNNGKLTSESTSGSAPLVSSTAVISVSGSPMNGQTVRLINTEGRFLRPGSTAGTLQDDQMQRLTGRAANVWGTTNSPSQSNGVFSTSVSGTNRGATSPGNNHYDFDFDSAGSPNARTGDETRPKNVSMLAFMRVK